MWNHALSGTTKVYSRSVDLRKLCVGVKYYVVHTRTHQIHILRLLVCARLVRAIRAQQARGFAAVLIAVVKPIQTSQGRSSAYR